jgi:hypothetical protein
MEVEAWGLVTASSKGLKNAEGDQQVQIVPF